MTLVGNHSFEIGAGQKIIVDSGTSFLLIPSEDRAEFLSYLSKDLFCMDYSNLPFCYCNEDQYEKFPDLRLTIDGNHYYIPKENYVMRDSSVCALGIMSHDLLDFWILGLNFFENYYTVFDQENRKVGFAPSYNSKPRLHELIEDDKNLQILSIMHRD